MAKRIWMTLSVIGIAVILGLGIYHSNASQGEPTLTHKDIKELVTSQYPGTITELELNNDTNGATYYVEIMNDGVEYELKMDGRSGEVITLKEKRGSTKEINDLKEQDQEQKAKAEKEKAEKEKAEKEKAEKAKAEKTEAENAKAEKEQVEKERANRERQQQQDTEVVKKESKKQSKKEKQAKNTVIDRNDAIAIALEQFSGKVDEVELEEEDGRLIYEIEIEADGEEAEIEIDAYTGEIIVIEIEDD